MKERACLLCVLLLTGAAATATAADQLLLTVFADAKNQSLWIQDVDSSFGVGALPTPGDIEAHALADPSGSLTSLSRAAENGVGRNFLLQSYLRAGEYQLTATARVFSSMAAA